MPYSKYSPKQKKLAALAGDPKKIDRADLMKIRGRKIASSFDIDPAKHKKANKGAKIYNKGKSTTNQNEKDVFMKRTGPQLPLAKRKSKKRYG